MPGDHGLDISQRIGFCIHLQVETKGRRVAETPDTTGESIHRRAELSTTDKFVLGRRNRSRDGERMTAQPTPAARVRLENPGDLIAAVPHLFGFHPVDSLVVVGLLGGEPTLLGVTLRADLPPPGDAYRLASQLTLPLTKRHTSAVALIVIGPSRADPAVGLPHRELVSICEDVFADAGILVDHQLWVPSTTDGVPWRCYDNQRCAGVLPDYRDTPMARASAAAGARMYSLREDIAATLAPVEPAVLARRTNLLTATSMAEPDRGDPPGGSGRAGLGRVLAAVRAFAAGTTTLTDEDVVALTRAISDHRVRDACLDLPAVAAALGEPPGTVGRAELEAAARLWTALLRNTPAPECAEAACLLAFGAYLDGDGVLAGIALDRAEQADPGHRLTVLMRDGLLIGLDPQLVRTAGLESAARALTKLRKE
jgi:hypothetical protein